MDMFQAIIIGIIEGFTEFLPISSTGHMIVASQFLGVNQDALTKAYEVIIQFAAIMAVMLVYRDKLTFKKIALWQNFLLPFYHLPSLALFSKTLLKSCLTSIPLLLCLLSVVLFF